MDKAKGIRCLDGTMLKIIAMISMVIDHVGDMFFPELLWLRMIGRLAMPVFAFCITEGYIHTRNRKKYLLRMGIGYSFDQYTEYSSSSRSWLTFLPSRRTGRVMFSSTESTGIRL